MISNFLKPFLLVRFPLVMYFYQVLFLMNAKPSSLVTLWMCLVLVKMAQLKKDKEIAGKEVQDMKQIHNKVITVSDHENAVFTRSGFSTKLTA